MVAVSHFIGGALKHPISDGVLLGIIGLATADIGGQSFTDGRRNGELDR